MATDAVGSSANTIAIDNEAVNERSCQISTLTMESVRRFRCGLNSELIELHTCSGDVVLDSFLGAGATAVAAGKANRHYIGYEISTEYVEVAMARSIRELES